MSLMNSQKTENYELGNQQKFDSDKFRDRNLFHDSISSKYIRN